MKQKQRGSFEELFTRTIMAGERRYYLDVKLSGRNLYLTLTESSRRFDDHNGKFYYEKSRIMVLPEDVDNLSKAFHEAEVFLKNYFKEHPDLTSSRLHNDNRSIDKEE